MRRTGQGKTLYDGVFSGERVFISLRECALLTSFIRYNGGKGAYRSVPDRQGVYRYSILSPIMEREGAARKSIKTRLELAYERIAELEASSKEKDERIADLLSNFD